MDSGLSSIEKKYAEKERVELYYYNDVPNVGDYFGFYILNKMNPGLDIHYSTNPDIISSGSILDINYKNKYVYVWGSGFHNRDDIYQNSLNYVAVRGELSKSKIPNQRKNIVLGDPGLLASKVYKPKTRKEYKIGICVHYVDTDYFLNEYLNRKDINLILMKSNDVERVIDEINKCEMIFSSSLHGIIFAHSYGIPAVHVENIPLYSKNNFKFYDYYSSINSEYKKYSIKNINFDEMLTQKNKFVPNRQIIQFIQNNLINAFPFRHNCVICCLAKNENNYIKEWLDYYFKLGFDHVYIFDNNNVGDDSLLKLLKNYKHVTIFDIRGKAETNMQKEIYTKFYNDFRLSFNWCLFCDVDEFVVLKKWQNINEMTNDPHFADAQAITFGWRLFGSDGKCKRNSNVVFGKFHKEISDKFVNKKVIIRGNIDNVVFNSSHYASTDKKEVIDQLTPDYIKTDDKIDYTYRDKNAYMNHYITKTLKEFINQKLYRGDVNLYQTIDLNYFFRINKKTLKYKLCLLYLKIFKKMKFN